MVALARANYGDPSPELATSLYFRARALVCAAAFEDARVVIARGVEMLESIVGPEHPALFRLFGYEAYIVSEVGSATQIIIAYERYIAAGNAVYPERLPARLEFARALFASALQRAWRLDDARAELAASEAALTDSMGPDHVDTLRAPVARLAALRWNEGRLTEARRQADRIRRVKEGPSVDSRHTAIVVTALVPATDVEFEAALAEVRRFDVESAKPGWRGSSFLILSEAFVLRNSGRWAEALALLEAHTAPPEGDVPTRLEVVVGLERGLVLAHLSRPDEARVALERVLPRLEVVGGTRRAALAEFTLAKLIYDEPASRSRSLALAHAAAGHFEQLGPGRADELAEIRRWIADHPA
jgi:hypothetical protein